MPFNNSRILINAGVFYPILSGFRGEETSFHFLVKCPATMPLRYFFSGVHILQIEDLCNAITMLAFISIYAITILDQQIFYSLQEPKVSLNFGYIGDVHWA